MTGIQYIGATVDGSEIRKQAPGMGAKTLSIIGINYLSPACLDFRHFATYVYNYKTQRTKDFSQS